MDLRSTFAGFVAAALLTGVAGPLPIAEGGEVSSVSRVFLEGEELVYNVRYAFLDLGQIRITTVRKRRIDGDPVFDTRAKIDSYSGVPFVDLHAVFESVIDSTVYSRYFMGKVKENDRWDFGRYTFDYPNSRVAIEVGKQDTLVSGRDTIQLESRYQDGLSIFFFARDRLTSGKRTNIPVLIKEKKVNTLIDFQNTRDVVEVEAVEYPVDVVKFEGVAEFTGIFGLTGNFTGWFSNDDARVPIKAKMEVIIGSITIELMQWKRGGWSPPRGDS